MSIRFHGVRKLASHPGATQPLLDDLEFCIEAGTRVAVLGSAKSGKTTLLRMMCGTESGDGGLIERSGRVSWPIPLSTFLMTSSTVATNIRFVARLYGVADPEYPRRIAEMFDFAEFLNVSLKKCPNFVRQRLPLAIPLGIGFDFYLFDKSLVPVDKEFKERAKALVAARTAGCGCVLVTNNPGEVEESFDSVYVLEAGRARYFAETKAGVEYFKGLLKAEKGKLDVPQAARGSDEEDDADGIGDMDVIGTAMAAVLE